MKRLFRFLRGLAKTRTKLVFKRLILNHKYDILVIAEPWMNFDDFPRSFLNKFNLKLFVVNNKCDLTPNVWCLCAPNVDLDVVLLDDYRYNHKSFGISIIYALTSYIKINDIWVAFE